MFFRKCEEMLQKVFEILLRPETETLRHSSNSDIARLSPWKEAFAYYFGESVCSLLYQFIFIFAFLTISDQYSSEKYVRLINLEEEHRELLAKEKKTVADRLELKRLEKEIAPLKSFLDDAASHRIAIKAEIGILVIFLFYLLANS
jgi:hypothetical protein